MRIDYHLSLFLNPVILPPLISAPVFQQSIWYSSQPRSGGVVTGWGGEEEGCGHGDDGGVGRVSVAVWDRRG